MKSFDIFTRKRTRSCGGGWKRPLFQATAKTGRNFSPLRASTKYLVHARRFVSLWASDISPHLLQWDRSQQACTRHTVCFALHMCLTTRNALSAISLLSQRYALHRVAPRVYVPAFRRWQCPVLWALRTLVIPGRDSQLAIRTCVLLVKRGKDRRRNLIG